MVFFKLGLPIVHHIKTSVTIPTIVTVRLTIITQRKVETDDRISQKIKKYKKNRHTHSCTYRTTSVKVRWYSVFISIIWPTFFLLGLVTAVRRFGPVQSVGPRIVSLRFRSGTQVCSMCCYRPFPESDSDPLSKSTTPFDVGSPPSTDGSCTLNPTTNLETTQSKVTPEHNSKEVV